MKIIWGRRRFERDFLIGNAACFSVQEEDLARVERCAQADDRLFPFMRLWCELCRGEVRPWIGGVVVVTVIQFNGRTTSSMQRATSAPVSATNDMNSAPHNNFSRVVQTTNSSGKRQEQAACPRGAEGFDPSIGVAAGRGRQERTEGRSACPLCQARMRPSGHSASVTPHLSSPTTSR
jgi:hypothetical protein